MLMSSILEQCLLNKLLQGYHRDTYRGFSPFEDWKQEQEENQKFQRERGHFVGVGMARRKDGSCSIY